MSLDGNERAKLVALLLNDPLSAATVQHGRMLTGTALFVVAAEKGIEIAGTGGIGGTTRVPTADVHAFMRLIVVVLLARFAVGVIGGMVQLRLRWHVLRSEEESALELSSSAIASARKEQLKYLLGQKLSGLSFATSVAMYVFMLAADALIPILAAALALVTM